MSAQEKRDYSTYVKAYYPNATELNPPSATTSYNCHGYAWHMAGGGDPVWIGYYSGQQGDEDIYWGDYSYVSTTETLAEKISYYEDNHSAIPTTITGTYISKWGEGPLMRHAKNYGPSIYKMDFRKYYARPQISGLPGICNQTTYTVNLPSECVVQWSVHPDLSIVNQNNLSITVQRNFNSTTLRTDAWIKAEIVAPVPFILNKSNIVIFKPGITQTNDLIHGNLVSSGGEVQVLDIIRDAGASNFNWSSSTNWNILHQGVYFTIFEGEDNTENIFITVEFDDPCGNRIVLYKVFYIPG
ncbi:MAG: hypothetical protein BGO34_15530 [Bacteroidia bacterium 44-10]|nr:MAG: hypothetical protein BGO34_15530 [Bacteroidia bacterium 44-10]